MRVVCIACNITCVIDVGPIVSRVGVGVTLGGVRRDCIGEGSWVVLAASWKVYWRLLSDLRVEVCSCGDLMPWRVFVRCAAAAIR